MTRTFPRDPQRFTELIAQAQRLRDELDPLLPQLAAARSRYMTSRSEVDRVENERIQTLASSLNDRHSALSAEIREAAGLDQAEWDELGEERVAGDGKSRLFRSDLVAEEIEPTGLLEDGLAEAIDAVLELLPVGWLDEEPGTTHTLERLISGDQPLSLVKGLRTDSEFPSIHRLRQIIRVARDYLEGSLTFDHFGGSTMVPQIHHVGSRLQLLDEVGGDVPGRLRRLWEGPSESVDATIFEILVAQACAEMGRRIEFIPENSSKTADLRCHDPFPLVIECKRKRSLSDYELGEEARMRALFATLHEEAMTKGVYGRFDLRLNVEASSMPEREVVDCLLRQRLAAHPERPLEYAWGSVAYHELPRRFELDEVTRTYSPNMLLELFDWKADLPEWDGIICKVDCDNQPTIEEPRRPVGLVWTNLSPKAVSKRAWSPIDLVGEGMKQIPPGEFGIIYLAYQEGAREEIADRRSLGFLDRIADWEHAANIRVPISLLIRLYPRALNHGNPDLIENTVRILSSVYGDETLFNHFPQSVFTPRRRPLA